MLLNRQQFNNALSAFFLLLLANSAIAGGGGNLNVSPDQKTVSPQPQLDSGSTGNGGGGSDGMKSTTMQAAPINVLSEGSVSNAGLSSVDPNSSVIFEVPVKINTSGQVTQEQLDLNNQIRNEDSTSGGGDFTPDYQAGDPIEYAKVGCILIVPGSGYFLKSKWITLDQNGNYDGIVKLGVAITDNDIKRGDGKSLEWICTMMPIPGEKDNYNSKKTNVLVGAGGSYSQQVSGTLEY